MGELADFFADGDVPRARVAVLLKHFSALADEREPWRVAYPLGEVLLLLTCATIASCDDFDDIVAQGAGIMWISCAGSRPIITAFPASAGCAPWSIASIPFCSGAVSKTGSRRCGRAATSLSPSMARPRGAATTSARG